MHTLKNITLYFVRHGETDWNLSRRLQGLTDIPLNATGRSQAARHGRVMAELDVDWSGFDFYASPLSRAAETMEIVRRQIGPAAKEPIYDDRLREGAFGNWEGRSWSEIVRDEPENHALFLERGWEVAPHGGESYSEIAVRLKAWAQTLTRDTVAVSHGGVSRVLRGLYLGIEPAKILGLPTPQSKFYRFQDGQLDTI
ncbi:hypothetical protein MNBD_ALPHA09-1470 [hydrothermal vent metagenome]|uniref:Phosphoglycerate mutase n=1 Tax=hydrothermal vent metagenome TaxID=652676 RepID=A0A3B0TVG9_9ZZZZ